LAQKTGLEVQRVIAAVDAIPPLLLVVSLGFAPCPFCSERRRIVNIFHAP
jgi:hypothetical protein